MMLQESRPMLLLLSSNNLTTHSYPSEHIQRFAGARQSSRSTDVDPLMEKTRDSETSYLYRITR